MNKLFRIGFLSVCLCTMIYACRSKKSITNTTAEAPESDAVSFSYDEPLISSDSLQFGLNNKTIFPAQLIRMEKGSTYFIALDTGLFNRTFLLQNEREEYYSSAMKNLSSDFIKIHRLAWGVIPVQELQNFDGAMLTIATYIPPTENLSSEMIRVKVVRMMENRLAEIPLLSEVRVFPLSGRTQICDLSGKCEDITRK